MKNKTSLLLAGFILSSALSISAAQALELTQNNFCKNYAAEAVASYQSNVASKCGFSDGRWNTDYSGHYNWCMQLPPETVGNVAGGEYKARKSLLAQCRSSAAAAAPAIGLKNFGNKPVAPGAPPKMDPQIGINLNLNLGGSTNQPRSRIGIKKFRKPIYKSARLDFCLEDDSGCGQDAADAFCEAHGFDGASRFVKARGKVIGYDTIQIGTGQPNDNGPASAFKSITCEK